MVPKKTERYGRLVIDATMKKTLGKNWRRSLNACIKRYRYSYHFPTVHEIGLQSHAAASEAKISDHITGISGVDITDNFHQMPCDINSVHLLAIYVGGYVFSFDSDPPVLLIHDFM